MICALGLSVLGLASRTYPEPTTLTYLYTHTHTHTHTYTHTHTHQVIIFLLYSFWVPQIVLNATKGIRHPLNRTYVVGMSAARCVSLCVCAGLGFVRLSVSPSCLSCLSLLVEPRSFGGGR